MEKLCKFMMVAGIIGFLLAVTKQILNPSVLDFTQQIQQGLMYRLEEILVKCTRNHYEGFHTIILTILVVGAIPVNKRVLGIKVLPGASKFTNPISLLGHLIFGRFLNFPRRVLGTRRVFGVLGRANIIVLSAFVIYDITSIGICVSCVRTVRMVLRLRL
jgi:hypothetical protein